MRGVKAYKDLFPEVVEVEVKETKGRDAQLLAKRDNRLCDRFYYLSTMRRMRYEDALEWLEDEFEISQSTITQRIQMAHMSAALANLKQERPHVKVLRRRWPKMVWD